jgi:hypothetical protein
MHRWWKEAILGAAIVFAAMTSQVVQGEDLDAATKTKLEAKVKILQGWAADAAIVAAVKSANTSHPAELKDMNQDKWKKLAVIDPIIKGLTKNDAAKFLKAKQDDAVAEAFLNSSDGCKVALLAKTTSWCHKGKPKHDDPMAGKTWLGPIEMDESTGVKSVQVAVPVLDGGKAVGSLVVGFNVAKLK